MHPIVLEQEYIHKLCNIALLQTSLAFKIPRNIVQYLNAKKKKKENDKKLSHIQAWNKLTQLLIYFMPTNRPVIKLF